MNISMPSDLNNSPDVQFKSDIFKNCIQQTLNLKIGKWNAEVTSLKKELLFVRFKVAEKSHMYIYIQGWRVELKLILRDKSSECVLSVKHVSWIISNSSGEVSGSKKSNLVFLGYADCGCELLSVLFFLFDIFSFDCFLSFDTFS